VVRSQSIHRIQESQALLGYHLWASTQRSLPLTGRLSRPDQAEQRPVQTKGL
jgi:hypothetical protein